MSHLAIDPSTEKGKIQLETIKWAEEQMNGVFKMFFENKFKLINGLHIRFNYSEEDVAMMQVLLSPRVAKDEKQLKEAIAQVKEGFKADQQHVKNVRASMATQAKGA